MKKFNKNIVTVLLMATVLSGCGNSSETLTEQASITEDTTVAETTEVTTIPIEDRKPKLNKFELTYADDTESGFTTIHYCFVPEEATELSDDINLTLNQSCQCLRRRRNKKCFR